MTVINRIKEQFLINNRFSGVRTFITVVITSSLLFLRRNWYRWFLMLELNNIVFIVIVIVHYILQVMKALHTRHCLMLMLLSFGKFFVLLISKLWLVLRDESMKFTTFVLSGDKNMCCC